MLPADHGDCFFIEYGATENPRRVLIDGGTQHSYPFLKKRIENLPDKRVEFELFVITHVDADHIGGSLEFLRNLDNLEKEIVFGDIWFNGWKQLSGVLGDYQGELVTDHLVRRKLPWNKHKAFDGRAVVIPDSGALPSIDLPGGLRLTLLSPNWEKLDKLKERWEKTITKAKLKLGNVRDKEKYFPDSSGLLGDELPKIEELSAKRFTADKTVANGSSIALLAEYTDGQRVKRCIFAADAHPGILEDSLRRFIVAHKEALTEDGRLMLDAFKISHHGSKNNLNQGLLDLVACPKFLFSTNGQQFNHPDPESVARVINFARSDADEIELIFNYKSDFNKIWEESSLQRKHQYKAVYPASPLDDGIVVEL